MSSPEPIDGLAALRAELNALDEEIVKLIARRIAVCRNVAHYKRAHNIPMMQSARVEQVKDRCAKLGAQLSINPAFIRDMYSLIINETCRIEDEIIDRTVQ